MRIVEQWNRWSREVVDGASLETSKVLLDRALWAELVEEDACLQGCWTRLPFKMLSNPNYPMMPIGRAQYCGYSQLMLVDLGAQGQGFVSFVLPGFLSPRRSHEEDKARLQKVHWYNHVQKAKAICKFMPSCKVLNYLVWKSIIFSEG